ncbi:hypothetical protein AB0C52_29090 [Streptomyces sp. NPDC048717]|uniref:hypothetical protein n=1 Tax=Streptomyces sp. NPDC048717 TaxID=3154928 RepID=UPI003428C207
MPIPHPQPVAHDVSKLAALIQAGGVWGLAPDWIPRTGYAPPSRELLLRIRDRLVWRAGP